MKLIDADRQITVTYYDEEYEEWSQKTRTIWDTILEVADEIPSVVDAIPEQHGYWITLTGCSNEGVYCSHCRKKVYKRDYSNTMKVRSKFCPNCGFKMDMDEIEK